MLPHTSGFQCDFVAKGVLENLSGQYTMHESFGGVLSHLGFNMLASEMSNCDLEAVFDCFFARLFDIRYCEEAC